MIINVENNASAPASISLNSGNALFIGGNNFGSAPVVSTTSGEVTIVGMNNYGEIDVSGADIVFIGETVNQATGIVRVSNLDANLVRVENHGT